MLVLRPEQIALLAAGRPVSMANGGGSSSSSDTSTSNVDKRLVVDNGALGISADNSTITLTDSGAVKSAIELADKTGARSSEDFKALLNLGASLEAEALKVLDKNTELAKQVSSSIGSAYEVAQSTVSGARDQEKTLLIVGAVAVVVLIALSRRKG